MNRRKFLKFLGVVPVAAVTGAALIFKPDVITREIVESAHAKLSDTSVIGPNMTATEVRERWLEAANNRLDQVFLDQYALELTKILQQKTTILLG